MKKLSKAWVTTNTCKDGRKYYTAHAVQVSKILGFIPIFWEMHIVLTSDNPIIYNLYYVDSYSFNEPHQFKTKQEAEDELMNQINIILDEYNKKRGRKVIRTEKSFLSYSFLIF